MGGIKIVRQACRKAAAIDVQIEVTEWRRMRRRRRRIQHPAIINAGGRVVALRRLAFRLSS